MAITPSQWSHALTIPESYTPSAATSGQTLVITESVIAKLSAGDQTTFWSNVENGGGDVRICESSDGTNQLPVEVVSLDNIAKTCVIWTRKPTYEGADSLYLFVGKSGETQPAVTDPFGRNAVWSDYEAVLHLNDTSWEDSTGNGYDATGSASVTTNDNPFGIGWAKFNGNSASALTLPTGSALNNSFLTVQAIVKIDSNGATDAGIVSNRYSTQGNNFFQLTNSPTRTVNAIQDGSGENTALGPPLGTSIPKWVAFTSSAANLISYIDGSQSGIDSSIASDNQIVTSLDSRIGTYFDASTQRSLNGKVGEVKIRLSALPPEYIATEYANQNNPAAFYGAPTLASTGGGGGAATLDANVTLPSLTVTGTASATLPQSSLSASINLTQLSAAGSASATLPNPQLSANITLPNLTAAGNASATLPNPTLQALITLPIITASGNASATLPQPTLSASITLPTITVSGNASATLPGFNLSGNITLPVITATGAAQATLPQPTLSASVTLPTFTVTGSATATEPSFTLSGNVTLPTLTATGAASATLPQPTLSGNITLPSIQVSGFFVGGEIVITIDASTNINEPQLSTNITEPTLSTNISE